MRYAMIMAGGSGTRLWPVSRKDRPKQLAPIIDGRSLLDIAIERAHAVTTPDRTVVCASADYLDAIRAASPGTPPDLLLSEPVGRDTLNAIGFSAAVLAKRDPDAVFCVLTADHLIQPLETFAACVNTGFELVESKPNRLATFAITPTFPATGYGYIKLGERLAGAPAARHVEAYVEKPDLQTATQYLASGEYGWNSGMFVWRAATFLDAVKRFQPEAHRGLMEIAREWGGPAQQSTLERVYPTLPKISVDYAILEPAAGDPAFELCAVEMNLSWSDVGSWPSYAEVIAGDEAGLRVSDAGGGLTSMDVRNTLVVNHDPSHHIALLGVSDLVVVNTADATLIMPASEAQRLKDLHARLPERLK